jgi:magnesium-transporting ATPase (P-type)
MANGAERVAHAWHAMTAEAALAHLGSGPQGLSTQEAAARRARHGPNRLPEPKRPGALARFLDQFRNLLIYVLLGSAAISAALGQWLDASVILAVVLLNGIFGFILEGRAEAALAAIRGLLAPHAAVLRDGRRVDCHAADLVPGDVVLIEAGDRVPADLRLLSARALRAEEAVLTGESVPADKTPEPIAPDAPLAVRTPLLFSGTLVVAGQGRAVVVATGAATEIGRISTLLAHVEKVETPLLRQMNRFARLATGVILGVAAFAFVAALATGRAATEAFMAVVGLSVAAIPEGLPAVLTATLAIGVRRMAARNAIIRHLPAVETLGAVGTICSDKTGTFTRNEMVAGAVVTPAGTLRITGEGYGPEAVITDAAGAPPGPELREALVALARIGALCNDATLAEGKPGAWAVLGDPMAGALLALAARAGVRGGLPRRDAIPFDARQRWMATLHDAPAGALLALKGAPEAVLPLCTTDPAPWEGAAENLALQGFRVLALAEATLPPGAALAFDALPPLTLRGLVGLLDPPRPEAIAAVAACRAAGIRVAMITGDHPGTARAIGSALRLGRTAEPLTGQELEDLDEAGLRRAAAATDIFARVSPEQKLRLVAALQEAGAVVAMTGDGVNDAPALKRADVGVAMGRKGTEAAKEAADMVLADDNFASIAAAVREGRTVHDNLRKVIAWTLPTDGGEALVVLAALLLGLALPITPVQILWINLVTGIALGLTLAFEPPEHDVMARPPRRPDAPLLDRMLLWRMLSVSVLMAVIAFGLDLWAERRGLSDAASRTIVVNAIVAMEVGYLFASRQARVSGISLEGLRGTPAIWIGIAAVAAAQALLTFAPPMQLAFQTASLGPIELAMCIASGAALLVVVEAEKTLRRTRGALKRGLSVPPGRLRLPLAFLQAPLRLRDRLPKPLEPCLALPLRGLGLLALPLGAAFGVARGRFGALRLLPRGSEPLLGLRRGAAKLIEARLRPTLRGLRAPPFLRQRRKALLRFGDRAPALRERGIGTLQLAAGGTEALSSLRHLAAEPLGLRPRPLGRLAPLCQHGVLVGKLAAQRVQPCLHLARPSGRAPRLVLQRGEAGPRLLRRLARLLEPRPRVVESTAPLCELGLGERDLLMQPAQPLLGRLDAGPGLGRAILQRAQRPRRGVTRRRRTKLRGLGFLQRRVPIGELRLGGLHLLAKLRELPLHLPLFAGKLLPARAELRNLLLRRLVRLARLLAHLLRGRQCLPRHVELRLQHGELLLGALGLRGEVPRTRLRLGTAALGRLLPARDRGEVAIRLAFLRQRLVELRHAGLHRPRLQPRLPHIAAATDREPPADDEQQKEDARRDEGLARPVERIHGGPGRCAPASAPDLSRPDEDAG